MPSAGNVYVTISAKDLTAKATASAKSNFEKLGASLESISLGQAATFGGIGLAIQKSLTAFAGFDKRVREIGTLLSDFNESTLQTLGDDIKSLAVDYGQSIDAMAKARYDAISAGFTDIQESSQLLGVAAKLAVGGVSDVAKTTDLLTSVLNSYQLRADGALKVSDQLFTTVRLGKTTIDQLASGIGRAASIAPTLGVSFEELSAAVATLTVGGQSTEQAVTALVGSMTSLLKPSTEMQKKLKELGFESGAAAVKSIGFADTLKRVTEGATEADKSLLFPNIEGLRAVLPLTGNLVDTFNKSLGEMQTAGGATDTAFGKMAEGISFRFSQLKTEFDILSIKIGEALLPIAEIILDVVDAFTKLPEGVQTATIALGALTVMAVALGTALGPAGLVITGIAALTLGMAALNKSMNDGSKELARQQVEFDGLIKALIRLNSVEKPTIQQQQERKSLIETLNTQYKDYLGNLNVETASVTQLKDALIKVNEQTQLRIALMASEEDFAEQQKKAIDAQQAYNSAVRQQAVAVEVASRAQSLRITEEETQVTELAELRKRAVLEFLESVDRAGNLSTQSSISTFNRALELTQEQYNFRSQILEKEVQRFSEARDRELQLYSQFANQVKTLQSQLSGGTISPTIPPVPTPSPVITPKIEMSGLQELNEKLLALTEEPIKPIDLTVDSEEFLTDWAETEGQRFAISKELYDEYILSERAREEQFLKDKLEAWQSNWEDTKEGQAIFTAGMKAINDKYLSEEAIAWKNFGNEVGATLVSAIGAKTVSGLDKLFAGFIERQESSFAKFAASLVKLFAQAVARMVIEARAAQLTKALFGGAGGGGLLGILGTGLGLLGLFFEKGGIVGGEDAIDKPALMLPKGPDKVPAMLSVGEAVIPRQSVEKNRELVEKLIASPARLTLADSVQNSFLNQPGSFGALPPALLTNVENITSAANFTENSLLSDASDASDARKQTFFSTNIGQAAGAAPVIFTPQGSDTVPYFLSPGDAVIPRESVLNNSTLIRELINSPGTSLADLVEKRQSSISYFQAGGIAGESQVIRQIPEPVIVTGGNGKEAGTPGKTNNVYVQISFNINTIDSRGVEEFVQSREFRTAISDTINNNLLELRTEETFVKAVY